MSATVYKVTAGVLAVACTALLVFTARQSSRLWTLRIANQHAADKMWRMRADRHLAVEKYNVTNAVAVLSNLQMPVILQEYGENPVLARAVELERQKAISDIIESLRTRTRQNYGGEPRAWIVAFGDTATRESQEALEEWFKELAACQVLPALMIRCSGS